MRHRISFTHEEAKAVYDALVIAVESPVYETDMAGVNLIRKALTKFEAVTQTTDQEGEEDERATADDDEAVE